MTSVPRPDVLLKNITDKSVNLEKSVNDLMTKSDGIITKIQRSLDLLCSLTEKINNTDADDYAEEEQKIITELKKEFDYEISENSIISVLPNFKKVLTTLSFDTNTKNIADSTLNIKEHYLLLESVLKKSINFLKFVCKYKKVISSEYIKCISDTYRFIDYNNYFENLVFDRKNYFIPDHGKTVYYLLNLLRMQKRNYKKNYTNYFDLIKTSTTLNDDFKNFVDNDLKLQSNCFSMLNDFKLPKREGLKKEAGFILNCLKILYVIDEIEDSKDLNILQSKYNFTNVNIIDILKKKFYLDLLPSTSSDFFEYDTLDTLEIDKISLVNYNDLYNYNDTDYDTNDDLYNYDPSSDTFELDLGLGSTTSQFSHPQPGGRNSKKKINKREEYNNTNSIFLEFKLDKDLISLFVSPFAKILGDKFVYNSSDYYSNIIDYESLLTPKDFLESFENFGNVWNLLNKFFEDNSQKGDFSDMKKIVDTYFFPNLQKTLAIIVELNKKISNEDVGLRSIMEELKTDLFPWYISFRDVAILLYLVFNNKPNIKKNIEFSNVVFNYMLDSSLLQPHFLMIGMWIFGYIENHICSANNDLCAKAKNIFFTIRENSDENTIIIVQYIFIKIMDFIFYCQRGENIKENEFTSFLYESEIENTKQTGLIEVNDVCDFQNIMPYMILTINSIEYSINSGNLFSGLDVSMEYYHYCYIQTSLISSLITDRKKVADIFSNNENCSYYIYTNKFIYGTLYKHFSEKINFNIATGGRINNNLNSLCKYCIPIFNYTDKINLSNQLENCKDYDDFVNTRSKKIHFIDFLKDVNCLTDKKIIQIHSDFLNNSKSNLINISEYSNDNNIIPRINSFNTNFYTGNKLDQNDDEEDVGFSEEDDMDIMNDSLKIYLMLTDNNNNNKFIEKHNLKVINENEYEKINHKNLFVPKCNNNCFSFKLLNNNLYYYNNLNKLEEYNKCFENINNYYNNQEWYIIILDNKNPNFKLPSEIKKYNNSKEVLSNQYIYIAVSKKYVDLEELKNYLFPNTMLYSFPYFDENLFYYYNGYMPNFGRGGSRKSRKRNFCEVSTEPNDFDPEEYEDELKTSKIRVGDNELEPATLARFNFDNYNTKYKSLIKDTYENIFDETDITNNSANENKSNISLINFFSKLKIFEQVMKKLNTEIGEFDLILNTLCKEFKEIFEFYFLSNYSLQYFYSNPSYFIFNTNDKVYDDPTSPAPVFDPDYDNGVTFQDYLPTNGFLMKEYGYFVVNMKLFLDQFGLQDILTNFIEKKLPFFYNFLSMNFNLNGDVQLKENKDFLFKSIDFVKRNHSLYIYIFIVFLYNLSVFISKSKTVIN